MICIVWITILSVWCTCANGVHNRKGSRSYQDYKLVQTQIIDSLNVARSLLILDGVKDVQFWKYPVVNQTAEILTSQKKLALVKDVLSDLNLMYTVVVGNIKDIDDTEELITYSVKSRTEEMNWKSYQRYNVIKQWILSMEKREFIVMSEVIGTTTEGRDILLTKISTGGNGTKPAIWIDGGTHAREWISVSTVTYMMNKLVTEKSKETEYLLDIFDWYFLPIVNADGYEYTFTTDRFWRKTRSANSHRPCCRGVDANRNWAFHWAESGGSSNPCSNLYHGPRPFSEPEIAAQAKWILQHKDQLKMFLSFHSYSQSILLPSFYTKEKSADYDDLYTLALEGKKAIEIPYGTKYQLGTVWDLRQITISGSVLDWTKAVAGIKYSLGFELRDTGCYGFKLPPNQIIPSGEETFAAVAAMAKKLYTTLGEI